MEILVENRRCQSTLPAYGATVGCDSIGVSLSDGRDRQTDRPTDARPLHYAFGCEQRNKVSH